VSEVHWAAKEPSEQASAGRTRLLEAYIPRDRRRALALGGDLPDRVQGAGLFADISGFTSLTETLANELGPRPRKSHFNSPRTALIMI
jgi:class 3 adenylate cyclase